MARPSPSGISSRDKTYLDRVARWRSELPPVYETICNSHDPVSITALAKRFGISGRSIGAKVRTINGVGGNIQVALLQRSVFYSCSDPINLYEAIDTFLSKALNNEGVRVRNKRPRLPVNPALEIIPTERGRIIRFNHRWKPSHDCCSSNPKNEIGGNYELQ